jgi:hypothetical protein
MVEEVIQQISKDTDRKYQISVNGVTHVTPRSLQKDLDRYDIPDLQKYTILQLAHQGLYATLLKGNMYKLLNWSNQHAPLTQEDEGPLKRQVRGEGTPNPYILVSDITPALGKSITVHIQDKKCDLHTRIRQGVTVYDKSAPSPYQGRTIFEFDTSCRIDLKTGKMHLLPHLVQINPLEGPVPTYLSTQEKEKRAESPIPSIPTPKPKSESPLQPDAPPSSTPASDPLSPNPPLIPSDTETV